MLTDASCMYRLAVGIHHALTAAPTVDLVHIDFLSASLIDCLLANFAYHIPLVTPYAPCRSLYRVNWYI